MTTIIRATVSAAGTRRLLRDSLIVSLGGQIERLLGTLTAFALREPAQIAWSVLGAVVLNLTLAINHRPGRYMNV